MKKFWLLIILVLALIVLVRGHSRVSIEGRTIDGVLITVTSDYWSLKRNVDTKPIQETALYFALFELTVQEIHEDVSSYKGAVAENSPFLTLGIDVAIPEEILRRLEESSENR